MSFFSDMTVCQSQGTCKGVKESQLRFPKPYIFRSVLTDTEVILECATTFDTLKEAERNKVLEQNIRSLLLNTCTRPEALEVIFKTMSS